MSIGRLPWRTPTGAMLWEIWGRHKWKFPWYGVALAASLLIVHLKDSHGESDIMQLAMNFVLFISFMGTYLHLVTCFCYVEVNPRNGQPGFPGRLLFKPVSTARLVLVPMLFGGAVVVAVFVLWSELVLRHLVPIPASNLLWISTVLLSFFWWMQALEWSLPLLKGRMFINLIMAVIHLLAGLMPQMPLDALSGWQWPVLAVLLLSALPVAWFGLKFIRQGGWEGPSWISLLWSRRRPARTRSRRKKFGSAFAAQFWLEWQRQGWLLPAISGGFALLVFPWLLMDFKNSLADGPPQLDVFVIIPALILAPSSFMGPMLAQFDLLGSRDLPVYIAIRPMTNGGFVIAKLVMALVTSALTWLVTLGVGIFWAALMVPDILLSKAGSITPYGARTFIMECMPMLLLLIIWTWKNLVAGMGIGLTGRAWIGVPAIFLKLAFLGGLILWVAINWSDEDFRATLLHWLPGLLIMALAAKLVVAIAAFAWGLRRKAITGRAVGWIVGGWSVLGLFVAGYAHMICHAINKPNLWIWSVLAGLLVLPLADLAITPSALAWNRHR